ncbi:MAG: hypothetical protein HY913_03365 [Desulfomonile tiedjei]|nr:hypothetical protein [Desulfomonile tiedjei]
MLPPKNKHKIWMPALLAATLLACFNTPVHAQGCGLLPDPIANLFARSPFLSKPVDQDQPGIANPAAPMVSPFCFSGEARIRPIWQTLTSAEYKDPVQGISLDLKRDLNFNERGLILESMARFQFSRFSGRIHYEANISAVRGTYGFFNWPDVRYGADVDVLCNKGFRLGLNFDLNRPDPNFSFALPNGTSGFLKSTLPVTMGVHAAYNPTGYCGLSTSFEVRARWPIGNGARVTEVEITGGVKAPTTIIGTSAVRGGWRYTEISFGDNLGREIDLKASGLYIDYTFFF